MTMSTINMTMNKRLERAIILILLLILIGIGMSGCANPNPKAKSESGSSVYASDSIGIVLGCVFDPANCKKYKKDADQAEITKDFEEVDKAKESESK